MRGRVLVATLLFLLIGWAYFQVDSALGTVRLHAPYPDRIIKIEGQEMRQIDALCYVLLPRLAPPVTRTRAVLVCQHYKRLVPILFILASLTGWCASVWLLTLQGKSEAIAESVLAFICSLLLAFIVGLVSYLVVLAPFFLFTGDTAHLESAAVFPLLGGLFMRTFFDRLAGLLSRIFDRLGGGKSGGDAGGGQNAKNFVLPFVIACTYMSTGAQAQLPYFRCTNPADKCIAFTEAKKADCPECQEWKKMFLNFSDVMRSARAAQKAAGNPTESVASNFFLDATSKELYGFDIAEPSGGVPKTSQVRRNPEKYGFRELREDESKTGAIAVIGNIAGIAVDESGTLRIAYPSGKTGEVKLELPSVLATAESGDVKYLTPTVRKQ